MRIISRLDIKNSHLIKSINFDGTRKIGNPISYAKDYYDNNIDEIFLINNTGSLYNTVINYDVIKEVRKNISIPIAGGGNIKKLQIAENFIISGCDKIIINSLAYENLSEVKKIISQLGSSSVVGSIQYSKKTHLTYYKMARELTGYNLDDNIKFYQDVGFGEILLTQIEGDGRYCGLDDSIIPLINTNSTLPILVGGGFKDNNEIKKFNKIASAIVISSALHFKKVDLTKVKAMSIEKF